MVNWENQELKPLFENLKESAKGWEPEKVMPRTKKLGKLVLKQLEGYTDGKYRVDRNEARGFFEAIDKFSSTGLPLSLDHFEGLINQYQDRITPYPHYSGIKVKVPSELEELDSLGVDDIPDTVEDDDEADDTSALKLM